jgi:UDP-glucose:(heptosyl)LPS alpha-1,3-glucosyltransferase
MKIALAIENFSRHAGGAEAYAVGLAETLIREGFDVRLYGHLWDGEPAGAVFHLIRRLPRWVPPSIRLLDFALQHQRMTARENFDVILGFGNTVAMNAYQSHGGVHYISNMRKLQAVSNPLLRFLKKLILFGTPKYHVRVWIESAPFRMKKRPIIVAISEMVRQDMARHFGVNSEEIKLVYNGIDCAKFAARESNRGQRLRQEWGFDKEILFLFMAYDFRKKGVRYLVEAADKLRQRVGAGRFGVVIVGSPPSLQLRNKVRQLKLSDTVIFQGPTTEPEVFYQACDVFILPTFYDACSLVVFEAMAAGLPAITSTFNGAAGIITEGKDGAVLRDPRDTDEMSGAMLTFLSSEVLRDASAAAKLTASNYTIERNHSQMIEIFRSLGSSLGSENEMIPSPEGALQNKTGAQP